MSKEAIEQFGLGKAINSRPKETNDEDAPAVVPEFDTNIVDESALEISDDNSQLVRESFDKQQASYVKHCSAKNKVRVAQNEIREHNAGYGNNNPKYTELSNELNTLTQELADTTRVYELDKASFVNDKKRFGRNITF